MRISDWSSDVCPSDLRPPDRGDCRDRSSRAVDHPGCWRSPAPVGAPAQRLRRPPLRFGPDGCASPPVPGANGPPPPEIGRAACRERVWQYVEILGAAVSLKKQVSQSYNKTRTK